MRRSRTRRTTDARRTETSLIEQALLGLAALAVVAMLSWPAARSIGAVFGWVPFWLLALPLSAWASLRWSRYRAAEAALRVGPRALRARTGARRSHGHSSQQAVRVGHVA